MLLVFLVSDFVACWVHRWLHSSPSFWEARKVHHSGTDLHLMLAFRCHPLERAIWEALNVALFFLLGATTETFVVFSFVNMVLGPMYASGKGRGQDD